MKLFRQCVVTWSLFVLIWCSDVLCRRVLRLEWATDWAFVADCGIDVIAKMLYASVIREKNAAEAVKLAGGDFASAANKAAECAVSGGIDDAVAAVAALRRVGAGADALEAKFAGAFPYSNAFGGAKATKEAKI